MDANPENQISHLSSTKLHNAHFFLVQNAEKKGVLAGLSGTGGEKNRQHPVNRDVCQLIGGSSLGFHVMPLFLCAADDPYEAAGRTEKSSGGFR